MRHRKYARAAAMVASVGVAVGVALGATACSTEAALEVSLPDQVEADFSADIQGQFESAVTAAVAASGSSGAMVGVWAPWSGSWVQGIGTVTPGGADVTTDMSIPAGAVTRSMTCDALYGLARQGTVHLDDPVTDWVSGMPGYEEITLGELCDSTSGMGSYTPAILNRLLANPERPWNDRELVAYGMAAGLGGDPGATYRDSDTGYVLLGMALERASREDAPELYREFVTKPLGLTHTTLPARGREGFTGMWSPNGEDGQVACGDPRVLAPLSPTAGSTASGVLTTIDELGRYTQALALQARSFDEKERFDSPLPAGPDASSWHTATGGSYQAGSLIGQYGSVPGHILAAYADHTTGMTAVVVLNNSRADPGIARALSWQLAAIASKAPGAEGRTAPEAGLPWTAEDQAATIASSAMCPIPEG